MQLTEKQIARVKALHRAGNSLAEIRRITRHHPMQIMRIVHPFNRMKRRDIRDKNLEKNCQKPLKFNPPDTPPLIENGRFLSTLEGQKALAKLRQQHRETRSTSIEDLAR